MAPVRSGRGRRTIGHYPLGIYEEADLSLERSYVLERRSAAFREDLYQEAKRCMLVLTKPMADFSRGCAHPAMRPPISATHPATHKDPEPWLWDSGPTSTSPLFPEGCRAGHPERTGGETSLLEEGWGRQGAQEPGRPPEDAGRGVAGRERRRAPGEPSGQAARGHDPRCGTQRHLHRDKRCIQRTAKMGGEVGIPKVRKEPGD